MAPMALEGYHAGETGDPCIISSSPRQVVLHGNRPVSYRVNAVGLASTRDRDKSTLASRTLVTALASIREDYSGPISLKEMFNHGYYRKRPRASFTG